MTRNTEGVLLSTDDRDEPGDRSTGTGHPNLSRRNALRLASVGLAGGLGGVTLTGTGVRPASAAEQYEQLRRRYVEVLCGPEDADLSSPRLQTGLQELNDAAATYFDSLDDRPDRVFTPWRLDNIGDSATDTARMQSTSLRLGNMARAWATPGCDVYGDETYAQAIIDGLQLLVDLQYHAGRREGDSWYHWEIGGARGVVDTAAILGELVPDELRTQVVEAIEWFIPDPNYNYPPYRPEGQKWNTGSNRLEMCLYTAVAGFLGEKDDRIALAASAAPVAFEYVTETDKYTDTSGYFRDGSYLFHLNVPYTGTYGAIVLDAYKLLATLAGSDWEISVDAAKPMVAGVERTYRPWVWNAQVLPGVCGRAVSRGNADAYTLMGRILMLSLAVEPELRAHWQGLVRGWLDRDSRENFFSSVDFVHAIFADRLLSSDTPAIEESLGTAIFPEMDRLTHRGPGWVFSLSTASFRTRRWEVMSGENILCWHQSAGTRYLHTDTDPGAYVNDWFPTMDRYRFPGTTIDSMPHEPLSGGLPGWPGDDRIIGPVGVNFHTGGTSVGGAYTDDQFYADARHATWVHQHQSWESEAEALLAWFTLDGGVVCLGTGITGGSGHPVETIVENRMVLNDEQQQWIVNGAAHPDSAELGWDAELSDVQSLTLPTVASYVMLDRPRTVHLRHEMREGAWKEINTGRSDTPITAEYQTAWIDHGPHPETDDGAPGDFAYLLAPMASADEAADIADEVTILVNNPDQQAVTAGGFTGCVFHTAGTVDIQDWSIDSPAETTASALLDDDAGSLELAIADHTQQRKSIRVTVELPHGAEWVVAAADQTLTHRLLPRSGDRDNPRDGTRLVLIADTSAHDGASHRITLHA